MRRRGAGPGSGPPGPAHEGLEEGELARRQLYRLLPARDLTRGRIEAQVPHRKDRGSRDRAAPHERPHPGEQLGEREGVGQVIVSALVEARTRSSTPSRAVSMMIGTHRPIARSRRHVAKPSRPWSMTSRMTASYSVASTNRGGLGAVAGQVGSDALKAEAAPDRRRHSGHRPPRGAIAPVTSWPPS